MDGHKNSYIRLILWAALAAIIMLAAGSCGRGHGEGSMTSVSSLPSAKSVSTPPQSDANNPWDVTAQVVGSEIQAQWRGHNIGDYDLDGAVGVADITPIAINFGSTVEYVGIVPVETGNNEYLACVDGDGNGSIGVSDITPIAQHFGGSCTGYRIYLGLRATGETELAWNAAFVTPPGNPVSPITLPFNESRTISEVQRYSFSFAKPSGFDGFGKLRIVATDGTDEGAFAESSEFPITGIAADTAPPYNTGGITGLSAAAKPGKVILSWGTWEDALSPPVDIEIAWGIPPLDPDTAIDRVVVDAAAQTYEIGGLTNEQECQFSCRFLDQATPANATTWLTPISATPSAHLYSLPPTGAETISPAAGLSPSVDACDGTATAVHDAYAPMVAYVSAGGGNAGQLMFARYDNGAWSDETASADTFSACSIVAAGDMPVIIASEVTPSAGIVRFWNDAELSGWNSEVVFTGPASNVKVLRNESDAQHPYVVFTTLGALAEIHTVYWDGGAWVDSPHMLGFADTILDISLTIKGTSSLEVLVTHGTVNPQQAQINSSIACLMWDIGSHTWSLNGDYQLTDDGFGNPRSAVSTTFWPDTPAPPAFLGAAGAIRLVNQTVFTYNVDVPYGDLLGMEPSGFGSQPQWVEILKGTTGINLLPLGLTLNWNVEPRWTESAEDVVFVNVAGTVTFTLNPFTITGGSLVPSWWTATYDGASWSASPLTINGAIPPGRGQDLAPTDTAEGFQMVYTQVDAIDVGSLLGGGELPTGGIFYARK